MKPHKFQLLSNVSCNLQGKHNDRALSVQRYGFPSLSVISGLRRNTVRHHKIVALRKGKTFVMETFGWKPSDENLRMETFGLMVILRKPNWEPKSHQRQTCQTLRSLLGVQHQFHRRQHSSNTSNGRICQWLLEPGICHSSKNGKTRSVLSLDFIAKSTRTSNSATVMDWVFLITEAVSKVAALAVKCSLNLALSMWQVCVAPPQVSVRPQSICDSSGWAMVDLWSSTKGHRWP